MTANKQQDELVAVESQPVEETETTAEEHKVFPAQAPSVRGFSMREGNKMAAKGAANIANVTTGKPRSAGALYWGAAGTTAPTDATTELDAGLECLGYVDSNGLKPSRDAKEEKITAWGGATVMSTISSVEESFEYTLIEALSKTVLQHCFGAKNVTGELSTGLKIEHKIDDAPTGVWVAEIAQKGGYVRRIVVENAAVGTVEPTEIKHDGLMGYKITLNALDNGKGVLVTEYIAKVES